MKPAALTVPEAAAAIGISSSLYYRQLRAGKVPGVQVGRRYIVPIAEWHRWLAGERQVAK